MLGETKQALFRLRFSSANQQADSAPNHIKQIK
jgi:ribosomal protein L29